MKNMNLLGSFLLAHFLYSHMIAFLPFPMIYLESAYFTEIENFLLNVL